MAQVHLDRLGMGALGDQEGRAGVPQIMESAYNYYHELVPTAQAPAEKMQIYVFASRGESRSCLRSVISPSEAIDSTT